MTRRSTRIVSDDVTGGRPRVAGSDLTVDRARTLVEEEGRAAAAIAEQYGLGVADVYAALAYAHRDADGDRNETDAGGSSSDGTDRTVERELLWKALDELDDVFYVYDDDRRLLYWNRRLADLYDLADDELAGMRPAEFFRDEDRQCIREAVDEVFETGSVVVEATTETADDELLLQLTGRLLVDDDGTVLGFSGIGRDVTDRRDIERRLERQNEQLETFARTVSHDLRNPLAVSKGFLELEREERDTENLAEVAAALDRMERIVDDVLAVARQGHEATDVTPVSLAAIAESAWSTTDTGGATLALETERTLRADEERLRRLLENLFRNSVEHGGDAVTITVEDTPKGFAVVDDGVGIDADDLERAFEVGVSGTAEGNGLGLDIVRTIADAHGWTVAAVESDDGGARIEFDVGDGPDADGGR
ncbi:ATP-binding protein [Natronoarchaeum rubrum]|uniref:ATP-binding protein n=1 Tax=Natronoarchaeum rubrum TaxID=755311 RepID=UPI00211302FD|nr:ATP-binding protein [Natronoarchaeum rubrum]